MFVALKFAGLHQGRMQKQVVRHDCCSDHSDCHNDHPGVTKVGLKHCLSHFHETRLRLRENEDLDGITDADGGNENRHNRFDHPHTQSLQSKQEQYIARCDDDRPGYGNVEQEVKGNGTPQRFSQICRTHCNFHRDPIWPAGPLWEIISTALCQVLAGGHTEAGGDHLKDDSHKTRQAYHPEQTILELCSSCEIRSPVPGIHVTDADQHRRTNKYPPLLPETSFEIRHTHSAVHPFKRQVNWMWSFCSTGSR